MRNLGLIACLAFSGVLTACSSNSNSSSSSGGSSSAASPILLPAATVSDEQVRGQWPATRPSVIYVGDFQLEAAIQPTDATQGTQTRLIHLGMLRELGQSPEQAGMQRAAKVKDDFEQAIVDTLRGKGLRTVRLAPDAPLPDNGWLVSGVFTDMDEGNDIRRAAIGIGAGEAKLDLHVAVRDLADASAPALETMSASGSSGHMPGGALALNPYAIAAKFVLNRNALEQDARRAGTSVGNEIAGRVAQMPASIGSAR